MECQGTMPRRRGLHVKSVFIGVVLFFGFIYFFLDYQRGTAPRFIEKRQSDVTLITAFFAFGSNKSKHLPQEYEEWMRNLLPWVETPMIIFTESGMMNAMINLRRGHPTHLQLYETLWDIPFLKDNNLKSRYQAQELRDPEILSLLEENIYLRYAYMHHSLLVDLTTSDFFITPLQDGWVIEPLHRKTFIGFHCSTANQRFLVEWPTADILTDADAVHGSCIEPIAFVFADFAIVLSYFYSNRHSPELYAIWNSKSWMLNQATQLNPFDSTYFYWIDIGSFRESDYLLQHFPDLNKVKKTFKGNEDKIHLFSVSNLSTLALAHDQPFSYFKYNLTNIVGGFFGGTKRSVKWFSDTFYAVHDENLEKGEFVGKDQILMNFIAAHYPSKVLVTCTCDEDLGSGCVDGRGWMYFLQWYAPEGERRYGCNKITAPLNLLSDI